MKNTNIYQHLTLLIVLLFVVTTNGYAGDLEEALHIPVSNDSSKVYSMVDQMPQIIGGIGEVYKNIKYPAKAIGNRTEGRVFVQFIVNKDGKVENPKVLKDIGDGCGDAAILALQDVNFTPGILDGVAVPVSYTLPVTFKMGN